MAKIENWALKFEQIPIKNALPPIKIYAADFRNNKDEVRAVGGLHSILYNIKEDRITFKVEEGHFTYFNVLYETHIEKNYLKKIRVEDTDYGSIASIPQALKKKKLYLDVYLEKEHIEEWRDYVLYLVKDDMPDLYYYYQESNRTRSLESCW